MRETSQPHEETIRTPELEAHDVQLLGQQNITLVVFAGVCAMRVGTALWVGDSFTPISTGRGRPGPPRRRAGTRRG
jgi:hypothetical protein